ncbi:MAG: FAD-binding oxidoreductase, partial [Lentilitoribacter sp.]
IRLTHDGRILIGTKRARLGWGNNHPPANDPATFQLLVKVLRDRFPEIPEVLPRFTWSGRVAISSDLLPFFDHYKGRSNVILTGGYGGHGIPMASYSGRIIADMLLGKNTDSAALFVNRKKRPPIPPEPFRWLIGHAMKHKMAWADNAIDLAARKRNTARPAIEENKEQPNDDNSKTT